MRRQKVDNDRNNPQAGYRQREPSIGGFKVNIDEPDKRDQ